ncbi:MAG: flagellar hook-basal body complex protein FliE [Planctomycetota bacterium]|jgi:flagellar hook-basal body complex protein FliE
MVGSSTNISGSTNAMKRIWIPGSAQPKVNNHSTESPQAKFRSRKTDIASVVSSMAKTDISFNAFADIKNELIESYRETMDSSL